MRLKEGIVVDEVKTFGNLKFSGLRREVYERDEEGNSTGVLIKRTYDLKSEAQGRMIQVSLPPDHHFRESIGAAYAGAHAGGTSGKLFPASAESVASPAPRAVGDKAQRGQGEA